METKQKVDVDNSPSTCIYALFDKVAGTNIQYFDSLNDETAIRLIRQTARNPESFLYKQRNDLVLYRLLEYVPKTGENVFNRTPIFSLSALPEYDETPFGLEKMEDMLKAIITEISDLKKYNQSVQKIQEDTARLSKQANVAFIDKLFKGNKE